EQPPVLAGDDDPNRMDDALDGVVPDDRTRPYDMAEVITRVVDRGTFLEVHAQFARNLITGLARLGGRSVGVVAQQPRVLAGALDLNASAKGARFIRCCDAFTSPLVTFVDVPGSVPGARLPGAVCESIRGCPARICRRCDRAAAHAPSPDRGAHRLLHQA